MANRQKTVEYWFPELAAVTDNTDTNFTQITVYLPESSLTFRSVFLEVIIQDAEASANNVSRRQVSLQLGAAGYSSVNNTNTLTASGEQKWIFHSGDFTSYFATNWSGTSMTCDARCLFDSAIGTPVQNWRCATARLVITYDYDETSATQVKTIRWPLITPITSLGTSKPGTATDAGIPAFDTELPETSKSIRQIALVVQGNHEYSGTTDQTLSWEMDSAGGVYTTGTYELGLNTSCWFRHCQIQTFATNSTHSWYFWASVASHAHSQAFLVITYEYAESSTSIWNSLLMPMRFDSPAGGTTNADYQKASIPLWIEEPTTITTKRSAIQLFWEKSDAISGMQYRVNSGSWSGALTSLGLVMAGGVGASHECTSDLSLARGINTLSCDVYRTDTADLVYSLCGLWIINYTSGKASYSGMHNHTIIHNLECTGTSAATQERIIAATAPNLPDTAYFINNIGIEYKHMSNTTGAINGFSIQVERLSGEGGIKWESLFNDLNMTDALVGVRNIYADNKTVFKRFTGDYDSNRFDVETSRRYRSCPIQTMWHQMSLLITYHSITYTVSGTISGSGGNTVTVRLVSNYNKEVLQETSRSGNGSYSFTVFDNTQYVWADAYEDATHVFRSALGYPS